MTKKFDTVKDINGNMETLKLGVRINDLWEVKNRNGGKHIEMVWVDDKVSVTTISNYVLLLCLT